VLDAKLSSSIFSRNNDCGKMGVCQCPKKRKVRQMSLGRVLRLLESMGFSRVDSEVYVYLAKTGPKSSRELSLCLNMKPPQLHSTLKNLKNKGAVAISCERQTLFSALSFRELLDLHMKDRAEEAKLVLQTRQELLSIWRDITQKNNT
jgi:sugar-specific transcriptional regulator TrmB